MELDAFPVGVAERLRWYVYRLIDPRNGETFYVGKGKADRVFQHVKGALADQGDEDATALKFQRIKDIVTAGLSVLHVIHRHGIETEEIAYQIEAALIDAYPGLHNQISGHGSGDYGVRHVTEIVTEYAAQEFEAREKLILINISKAYEDESQNIYEAVRGCWKINVTRAKDYKLILAHRRGLVLGAFRPTDWLDATKANFPALDEDIPERFGFVGNPAEPDTARLYLRKRVPDRYRTPGAAYPIKYVVPAT